MRSRGFGARGFSQSKQGRRISGGERAVGGVRHLGLVRRSGFALDSPQSPRDLASRSPARLERPIDVSLRLRAMSGERLRRLLGAGHRINVTPGSPSKSRSPVTISASCRAAVAKMIASAMTSPCSKAMSAASNARLSANGYIVVVRSADIASRSSLRSRRTTL